MATSTRASKNDQRTTRLFVLSLTVGEQKGEKKCVKTLVNTKNLNGLRPGCIRSASLYQTPGCPMGLSESGLKARRTIATVALSWGQLQALPLNFKLGRGIRKPSLTSPCAEVQCDARDQQPPCIYDYSEVRLPQVSMHRNAVKAIVGVLAWTQGGSLLSVQAQAYAGGKTARSWSPQTLAATAN